MGRVLVTGALGNVGAPTVAALQLAGIAVRAAGLDRERVRQRFPDAEVVRLDFLDPATFGPALRGCDALFLMRPPSIGKVKHTLNRLIDAAVEQGLRHVVFSSVAGADTNWLLPHHRVETHLQASGLSWTMLRPGFFAQNLGDAYRIDIRDDRRLFVPAAEGRVAFFDTRDLGEVAACVLRDPDSHAGRGYTLTGPEAVTFTQVAELLSVELGRPIRYDSATVPGYFRHLRRRSAPLAQIAVQTILHTGLRRGSAERVDPTLERLLGRPGRTLATYIHDHRSFWA